MIKTGHLILFYSSRIKEYHDELQTQHGCEKTRHEQNLRGGGTCGRVASLKTEKGMEE